MKDITLQKYQGLGNDYLILDPEKNERSLQTRNIEMLCRRNFGVGADGILFGPLWEQGKIGLRIFNPDGSEAEQSGNGACIFAKYLLDEGYITERKIVLDMLSGETEVEFLREDGGKMRVNMGRPAYAGPGLPLKGLEGEIVNAHLRFCDNDYNSTCLSVGTPNCVIMLEEVTPQKAKELGPYVEQAEYFPDRMNMQLCKVTDRKHIMIEIYERGAGYTLASGTGACAAAAAAKRMGLVDETVIVQMPGGSLLIEFEQDDIIYMTGSVEKVGSFTVAEHFFA